MGRTPDTSGASRGRLRVIAAAVALGVIAGLVVPLVATSTPKFFARYHLLNRRYVNLQGSAHEGIGCRACHEKQALNNGVELTLDFYASLVRPSDLPRFFTFEPPRRERCLACHEDGWSFTAARTERIPHPAHPRLAAETRECARCHKWTAHLEPWMEKHKKMPFSGVCVAYGCHAGTKDADQCLSCHHILHESAAEWREKHASVAASIGKNACLERCHDVAQCQTCHTTGRTPRFAGQTFIAGMERIEALHISDDWTRRHHGREALRDRAKCALCHQASGECDECHRERPAFHGRDTVAWIGRHSKHTKDVDDPRCLECHDGPWCEKCHVQFKEME